jgi:hypothetical protein
MKISRIEINDLIVKSKLEENRERKRTEPNRTELEPDNLGSVRVYGSSEF